MPESTFPHRPRARSVAWTDLLNTRYHKLAMYTFLAIVLAHWAEHLAQAFQVWALHWPRPEARGVLGLWFPWLVTSEWLHYAYAIVMLVGLILLRPAITGRARLWWDIALWIQVWHHFEHALLLGQALLGANLAGMAAPTSLIQLVVPRVELHLFYNAAVFAPMVVGMLYHVWPPAGNTHAACTCRAGERAPSAA